MKPWKLHFDGSCSKQLGSGAGVIIESPEGVKEVYHRDLRKGLTCNQSEYVALVTGLEIAKERNIQHILVKGDSKLICNQVSGNWEVKSEKLRPFYQAVKELSREFKTVKISHIPREENYEADAAAKKSAK